MSSHRVLLIDDEPDILTILSLTLKSIGNYEIETCCSGGAALQIAPAFLPDTIFLDVMMPDMDGLETLSALRSQSETADTPVIIMTAKSGAKATDLYRRAGAAAVLSKPFRKEELASTLRAIGEIGVADADDHGQMPNRFAELADRYAERLPGKISEIESTWQDLQASNRPENHANSLRVLAHKLAGTAASYGYRRLGAAASALERELDAHLESRQSITQGSRATTENLVRRLIAAARRRDD